MRQKEDRHFAELLNRLREGNHTKTGDRSDLETLKACIVNAKESNRTAQHFFRSRREVADHNEKIFAAATTDKTSIYAHDAVVGDTHKTVQERIKRQIEKRQKDPNHDTLSNSHNTANLDDRLDVAVGLRYHVTINVDVEDGLTNGADCVLKKIQYLVENKQVPSILWVLFDDKKIGRQARRKYSSYFSAGIDKNWTPVFAVNRNYQFHQHTVIRTQFPLTPAAAKTIHKAQGLTYDEIVVKMRDKKEDHMHYVALSRVRNLAGLQILELHEDKITVNPLVKQEMERLRSDAQLNLCFKPIYNLPEDTIKLVFHNTRSLHKHIQDLKSSHLIQGAHIIGIAESRLMKSDSCIEYALTNYNMTRNDQTQLVY